MRNLVDGQFVQVTNSLAGRFVNMERWSGDRRMNKTWVECLRAAAIEGFFVPATFAYVEFEGRQIRIDGQHSSKALSMLDLNKYVAFATVLKFQAKTLEEIANLYNSFSPKARTAGEHRRSIASSHELLASIPQRPLNNAAAALQRRQSAGEHRPVKMANSTKAKVLLTNPDFVKWYSDLAKDTNKTEECANLLRAPVATAMLLTWEMAPEHATRFWTAVRDGTGPNVNSGDRALQRFLLGTTIGRSGVSEREFYHKSIHAWNAWVRGAECKKLQYRDTGSTPAPLVPDGVTVQTVAPKADNSSTGMPIAI